MVRLESILVVLLTVVIRVILVTVMDTTSLLHLGVPCLTFVTPSSGIILFTEWNLSQVAFILIKVVLRLTLSTDLFNRLAHVEVVLRLFTVVPVFDTVSYRWCFTLTIN